MKKIITRTYEAFDGKIFTDENQCRDYEFAEKAKSLELTLLNDEFEILPNSENGYGNAVFIIVNKQEDIDFIKTIAEEYGCYHPWDFEAKCEEKLGIYYYDENLEQWVNFDDLFAEFKQIYEKCFKYRVC